MNRTPSIRDRTEDHRMSTKLTLRSHALPTELKKVHVNTIAQNNVVSKIPYGPRSTSPPAKL